MFQILIFKVLWLVCFQIEDSLEMWDPDYGLTEEEVIPKYGYRLEIHSIRTEDGYILKTFRIPYGRNDKTNVGKRPPVLIIPGFATNSAIFVSLGTENSLGFFLADRGFDVWLGNVRGTRWSKKHETLSPTKHKKKFWNFGQEEIGLYDLPAMIDYITNATKQEKIFYIGYSQGGTVYCMMASERPEYNKKIRLASLFTPVTYTDNLRNPIYLILTNLRNYIQTVLDNYQIYELLNYYSTLTLFSHIFCNDKSVLHSLCINGIFSAVGYSSHFNQSTVPLFASIMPTGVSSRQFLYGLQLAVSKFQRYDYGVSENLIKYGQRSPPAYNLSKVTAPVALYYGENDLINDFADVQHLAADLPNVAVSKLIKGFNHADFMGAAVDVVKMLYNDVVKYMKKF